MATTDQYRGKTISAFKDEFGKALEDLDMKDMVKIEFTDGTSLQLHIVFYGQDAYICEREE